MLKESKEKAMKDILQMTGSIPNFDADKCPVLK